MSRLALVAALLLVAAQAHAMTLDEAMRVAVTNNPLLAGKFVDVEIAGARVLEARGIDDFVVDASGTWTRSRGDNAMAQVTPFAPYDRLDLAASLTRRVSTGGSVALRLTMPYIRRGLLGNDGSLTELTASGAYMPSVQLVLTQPLLRGRGYDVSRARLRQAVADRDVGTRRLVADASVLMRDVSHAYWELAFANGEQALRRAALDATREQLAAVAAQIDVGKQSPSASAEVEVSVALREDEVVDSERRLAERRADLARLLGFEGASDVAATERPRLAGADRDVLARALDKSAELSSLRAQAMAAQIDIDVAENGMTPVLDVFASGGPMGVATEAGAAMRNLTSGYTMQAGIVFQEPVERRAQRGARDAAYERATKARLAESEARTRIVKDVATSLAALDATARRAALLGRAVEVAELDLASERARFQANRSTSFDVLRRQQAATEVRIRLLRTEIDNAKAAAALDALTTDILPRHGIQLRRAR